jgi:hypothetical protein
LSFQIKSIILNLFIEKLFNSLDENRNKVQDNTMEKYVPDVKRMIKKVRG